MDQGLYKQTTETQVSDVVQEVEPLLKEPFNLYGSHLSLAQRDRVALVQRELIQTYKAKIFEQDDYIGVLKSEREYFKNKNAKYILRNIELER